MPNVRSPRYRARAGQAARAATSTIGRTGGDSGRRLSAAVTAVRTSGASTRTAVWSPARAATRSDMRGAPQREYGSAFAECTEPGSTVVDGLAANTFPGRAGEF